MSYVQLSPLDLALASLLVRIPCAPEQPTLNLAQTGRPGVVLIDVPMDVFAQQIPQGQEGNTKHRRPNYEAAAGSPEVLVADLSGSFVKHWDCDDTVKYKRNGVLINLLQAGHVLKAGCRVPFPVPIEVWDEPRFVSLEKLIALKLDSWSNSHNRRHKDKTDVIELIQALRLPRDLAVDESVRTLYVETWDALAAEPG